MGAKGAVEIIFRGQDIGAKASERTLVYDDYQDGCVCVVGGIIQLRWPSWIILDILWKDVHLRY